MMTREQILAAAAEMEDYCKALRREFHENPELSGREFNTVRRIREELDRFGVENLEIENGGILAVIRGAREGKTLLIRADVDALPIQEDRQNLLRDKEYISKVSGLAHVCGHDAHAAMLTAAAKIFADNRDGLRGTLVLMYERGEEGTGNLRYLIDHLQQNNWAIDGVWGMHLNAELPTGRFALRSGTLMAGALLYDVTLTGAGGHGSRPDWANNPVDCFTAIQSALQTLRMRAVDPSLPITFSTCKVRTESNSNNVIGDTLTFGGTVRFFDRVKAYRPFADAMRRVIDDTARAFGCAVTVNQFERIAVPLSNHPVCHDIAKKALTELFGSENVIPGPLKFGSETLAYLTSFYPGMYLNLGVNNPALGSGSGHHSARFDIDPAQLKTGIAAHIGYAQAFLNSDEPMEFEPYGGTIWDLLAE